MRTQHARYVVLPLLLTSLLGCAELQGKNTDNTKSSRTDGQKSVDVKVTDIHERDTKIREAIDTASKNYRDGNFAAATDAYNNALQLDPINQKAQAGLKKIQADQRHAEWLSLAKDKLEHKDEVGAEKILRKVLVENPDDTEAQALLAPLIAKVDEKRSTVPMLKSASKRPISMEFRDGDVKAVFEALSKTTGFNFILDKDIQPDQKISVFLKNATLEDAIDGLLAANNLQKKVLNETTMVVYPNTPFKAKEYQDLVVRSYYIANGDVTKVQALLKSMLQLKDMYVDERLGLIVLKDTPEALVMADKLIQLQDRPDPEVVLEVEVLEINRSRISDLGINYPQSLSVVAATSGTTTAATSGMTLKAIQAINKSSLLLNPYTNAPVLGANFGLTEKDVNLLANPSIRVRNREKAKIHVGNRIPITTSNVSSNGVQSQTIQYIDDGLKLDVEPSVNSEDEVSIRVNLEVSTAGQTTPPTIGTRSASTMLRLKDGETQVLAGLIQDSESNSANKLPGLGDIPLIGNIFSNKNKTKTKTDILLSITPHVIRNVSPLTADVAQFWLGPESAIGRQPTNISVPGFLQNMMPRVAPSTAAPAANTSGTSGNSSNAPSTLTQPIQGLPGGLMLTPNGLQQSR